MTIRKYYNSIFKMSLNFHCSNIIKKATWKSVLDTIRGRCGCFSLVGLSKIKIWTSSCDKARWALLHDEVRILILDLFCDRCVTHNVPYSFLLKSTVRPYFLYVYHCKYIAVLNLGLDYLIYYSCSMYCTSHVAEVPGRCLYFLNY